MPDLDGAIEVNEAGMALYRANTEAPLPILSVWKFVEDIRSGNIDGFMERMRSIIAGEPYDSLPKDKLKLREQNYQTAVYLIFKLMSVGSAEDAVTQIKEKAYAEQFKACGKQIILIGSSFDEEERTIKDWVSEVL